MKDPRSIKNNFQAYQVIREFSREKSYDIKKERLIGLTKFLSFD